MYTVYDMTGTEVYAGDDRNAAGSMLAAQGGMGWMEGPPPADTTIEEDAPMASVTPDIADAFGMGDMPNVTVLHEDEAPMADDSDEDPDEDPDPDGDMAPVPDDADADIDYDAVPIGWGPDWATLDDPTVLMHQSIPGDVLACVMADDEAPVATVMQLSAEGATATMAQARHAQLAKDLEAALGMSLGPSTYGAGVVLGEVGVRRFHASYDAWATRPLFEDAAATVAASIKGENRLDYTRLPARATMDDTGAITLDGTTTLRMEEQGFKLLLSQVTRASKLYWSRFFGGDDIRHVFPRAYHLMAVMPPDLRATVWNRMISECSPGLRLMWRTRQPAGQDMPSLFAVASETYGAFDGDKVLALLGRVLTGSGARGSIVYEPRTTNLYANASWHADRVFDVASNDVMGLSVSFRSNDARAGSITALASAECGFGRMTYGTNLVRIRHIGTGITARATSDLHAAVGRARVAFDSFLRDWGHLPGTMVDGVKLYGATYTSAAEAFRGMVETGRLDVPGTEKEALIQVITRAWDQEPGETLAHMAKALTRAATHASFTAESQDIMEHAAGTFVTHAAAAARG